MPSNIATSFFLHLTDDKKTELANELLTSASLNSALLGEMTLDEITKDGDGNHALNNSALEDISYPIEDINGVKVTPFKITSFIDGRGLACPQPLLKAKIALRSIDNDETVYLVATDANSQYDIKAYATHAKLALTVCQGEHESKEIWHFLLGNY